MRTLRLGCAIAALIVPAVLQAQETTATLRGAVTTEAGAPISNATVTIIHTPSGTRTTQTTDASGSFNATGLRLGGPFSVQVTAPGYDAADAIVDQLLAGTPQRIEVLLAPLGQTITVTASRNARSAISIASGPATILGARAIEGVASINRDIRDLARRDPLVSIDPTNSRALSIAGQNNRFNRITVDGVAFGDPFGLNNGGLASARGPVPLDAICQFSVEIAPVDIQQGNFQGGAINTQLCSGTNNFHAKGFFTYTDDSLAGKNTRGTRVIRTFDSKSYGGHFEGPIIKDKLFFALTYEGLRASTPALVGLTGEGFANSIPGITRAQVEQIKGIAKSVYSYDTLDVAKSVPEKDDKYVAKLDWNIADGHRLALTGIYNKGDSLAGNTPLSQLSASNPTLSLQSNNYDSIETNYYGVAQLNDSWSDVFSTQVRVSYNDYKREQTPFNGSTFGDFTVCLDPTSTGSLTSCTGGVSRVEFGPDISRQANALRVKSLAVELQAQIKMNNHAVKIIAERREQRINDIFQQNFSGAFYFDSIADFQARKAGSLTLAKPVNGDVQSGAGIFKSINYTFGVQDVWDASSDLTLIYGFRYDLFDTPDTPPLNPNFVARYGYRNNATIAGRGVFQPRAAFTFSPGDNFRLRGQAGRFAGGSPNVWVTNSYLNPGTAFNQINVQRTASAPFFTNVRDFGGLTANQIGSAGLDNVSGGSGIPSVFTQFVAQGLSQFALTNAIDPNFKIPSQYRYTLSADYKFTDGFLNGLGIGGDVVYSRTSNGLTWTDIRSVANGKLPDGRPRYKQTANTAGNGGTQLADNNQDVLLYNTDKGYSMNFVARAVKDFDFGLHLSGAYIIQRAKDVSSGTSSVALSNYSQTAALDPNQSAYGTSNYQIDNTIKASVGFDHSFFKDAATRFDLFFESRAGQRYSYTVADLTSGRSAVFGTTGTNNRYLAYIPTGPADPLVSYGATTVGGIVTQSATQAQAALDALISSSGLQGLRGSIAPKNFGRSPRFNKLDLHIGQEVPLFRGLKVEVFGDIENVLNLLNHDWGSLRQVSFPYYGTVANVSCLVAPGGAAATSPSQPCAQYQYSNIRSPALTFDNVSLWQIRVGARVRF